MLCSLPNAKSGSTWLDRLHALKGFNSPASSPPNPNPNPNPSSDPDPLPRSSNPSSTSTSTSSQMRPVDVMSNVLADLFVMDPPKSAGAQTLILKPGAKRGLRKQPSPRICILSSARKCRGLPPSASNGVTELRNKKRNNKVKVIRKNKKVKNKEKAKEKEKRGIEIGSGSNAAGTASKAGLGLKGRTEATVIDTSTPGWKSAKILIRKGPIWKVMP